MKTVAVYAAISAAVIVALALLLSFLYGGVEAQRAIMVSAGTAFTVQLFAFALLRSWRGPAVMLAWGIGALARFVVVAIYALLIIRTSVLPVEPALISLALFFVICTLIEPFLLEHKSS